MVPMNGVPDLKNGLQQRLSNTMQLEEPFNFKNHFSRKKSLMHSKSKVWIQFAFFMLINKKNRKNRDSNSFVWKMIELEQPKGGFRENAGW